MFGVIVLVIVILVAWSLFARGSRFVEGFSQLLERPVCQRLGPWSFITGAHQIDGEYEGRPTALTLRPERGTDTPGNLMVSMQALGAAAPSGDDVSVFPESIRDHDGRRAMYDLVVKHDVTLALDGRWLKATWSPVGFLIFPGRFEPERWRKVLRAMRRVVQSLEGGVSPTK